MQHVRSIFKRPLLLCFTASAAGGAAYRYYSSPLDVESASSSLNPRTFTPFTLVSKQPVSSTSSLFTLRRHDGMSDEQTLIRQKGVWSVQIKQPQLQIARAYTPLPPTASNRPDGESPNASDIRLLIRKEENGEVSGYLHRLPPHATVELRGPQVELELPQDVAEVLFLAGGTGIAPAMQVAHALAQRPGTRMHVLWANRRREDCMGGKDDGQLAARTGRLSGWRSLFGLEESVVVDEGGEREKQQGLIVKELETLKNVAKARGGEGLTVEYFVDEEGSFVKPADVLKKIRATDPKNVTSGQRLVLISGPDGFLDYWAGHKVWAGGREVQGPLGGVLSQLDLKGWKVWKL